MNLKEAKQGMTLRVESIGDSLLKERLMTMGLIPGVRVKVMRSAPLGDPMAISIVRIIWQCAVMTPKRLK